MTTKLRYNQLEVGKLYKGIDTNCFSYLYKYPTYFNGKARISQNIINYSINCFMFIEYQNIPNLYYTLALKVLINNLVCWIEISHGELFEEIK